MTAATESGPRAVAIATELAPLALVVIAEAAWISVVGGLLQEFALRETVLGIPALAAFVTVGIVAARLLAPQLGSRWLGAGLGLVLGAGVVGWLLSGAARDALAEGIGPALAAHPGGWLAGLALLRGFAHARLPLAEHTITNLLAIGIPGLALAATLGGVIADPYRARFVSETFSAAIVYVAATILALAFARIDTVGLESGFDWRRNPAWLVMMIAIVAVGIIIAIPLAGIAGTVISVLFSVALGPMLIVGLATGLDRTARRILGFFIGIVIALVLLSRGFGITALVPDSAAPSTAESPSPATEQLVTIGVGGLVLLGIIVGIIVAIALWMRQTPAPDGAIRETRTIDPSGDNLAPRPRRNRFGRRHDPTTAVEAYVALVGDLERHPDIRRDPAETPAAHAARLRALGQDALSLDLLAADYALARYGGMALSAREERRAIGRWRSLRKRLVDAHLERPGRKRGSAIAPDARLPVDLEPRRTF